MIGRRLIALLLWGTGCCARATTPADASVTETRGADSSTTEPEVGSKFPGACEAIFTNATEVSVQFKVRSKESDWKVIGLGPRQTKDYTGACSAIEVYIPTLGDKPVDERYSVRGGTRLLVLWNATMDPPRWQMKEIAKQ